MRVLSRWASWGALGALIAPPGPADAQEEPPAAETAPAPAEIASTPDDCFAERFVELSAAPDVDPALVAEVRTDLATELEHRGLAVCGPDGREREPAARVLLREAGEAVVVELDDRVTNKRVARDLSLVRIPPNGRALAIAIAIDELLRASWAELTLQREPPEQEPLAEDELEPRTRYEPTVPVNARGSYRRPRIARAHEIPVHLGAGLGYAHTAHAFDAFSLNLRASLRPAEIGWFELGLGGLASLPAQGQLGSVLADGLTTALTIGACSRGSRGTSARVFGCAGARAGVDWLSLRGVHAERARTRREQVATVHASLATQLAVSLSSELYLFGEMALGALVRGVRANEGTNTVMGVTGLLVALQIGLGF